MLKADKLKEIFNTDIQKKQENESLSLAMDILKEISESVDELLKINIPLQITIYNTPSENSFALDNDGGVMPFSGLLKVGSTEHLLGIWTNKNNKDVKLLQLSELEITQQGNRKNSGVRSVSFNLFKADGIEEFQEYIISRAAREELIQKSDVKNIFTYDYPKDHKSKFVFSSKPGIKRD